MSLVCPTPSAQAHTHFRQSSFSSFSLSMTSLASFGAYLLGSTFLPLAPPVGSHRHLPQSTLALNNPEGSNLRHQLPASPLMMQAAARVGAGLATPSRPRTSALQLPDRVHPSWYAWHWRFLMYAVTSVCSHSSPHALAPGVGLQLLTSFHLVPFPRASPSSLVWLIVQPGN